MLDGDTKETLTFILSMFVGSSVAGWAMLAWENKPITARQRIGGVLLSGFSGVIVALLLYEKLKTDPAMLAGVSLLSGIGGASTIEWLAVIIKKRVLGQ